MSTTYSAVCDDCKERCWVGQSDYFYSYKYIPKFFHKHIGHKMSFINDNMDDDLRDSYSDFEDNEGAAKQ